MGASTVAALIARGQNQNEYNQTGIDSSGKWVDYFNDALQDLADDLLILAPLTITLIPDTREYDLPEDFLQLHTFTDNSYPVSKRRTYEDIWCQGYWIMNKGSKYVIDLVNYSGTATLSGLYQRYAALLPSDVLTVKPEVPTMGENALIYYAISKGLRNNNFPGQSQEVEGKYERERQKIRNAAYRSMYGVMS